MNTEEWVTRRYKHLEQNEIWNTISYCSVAKQNSRCHQLWLLSCKLSIIHISIFPYLSTTQLELFILKVYCSLSKKIKSAKLKKHYCWEWKLLIKTPNHCKLSFTLVLSNNFSKSFFFSLDFSRLKSNLGIHMQTRFKLTYFE